MVKEKDRKRPYKARGPHKPDCQCGVCVRNRKAAKTQIAKPPEADESNLPRLEKISPAPAPPEPSLVELGKLAAKANFEYEGAKYIVMEKIEGMAVCYNLLENVSVTLSNATLVKNI